MLIIYVFLVNLNLFTHMLEILHPIQQFGPRLIQTLEVGPFKTFKVGFGYALVFDFIEILLFNVT